MKTLVGIPATLPDGEGTRLGSAPTVDSGEHTPSDAHRTLTRHVAGRLRMAPMAVVRLRGPLRKLAGGQAEHELDGESVLDVMRALELEHPALAGWIIDERGLIRRHLNVFVNGNGGTETTTVRADDRVEVVPAITGG